MRFAPLLSGLAMLLTALASSASESPLAPLDLARRLDQANPPLVLDVRTPAEFADGHIPGAVLIPHDRLEQQLATLEPARDREIVLYCRSGRRSLLAENALREHGFTRLRQLDGSWRAWDAAGLPRAAGIDGKPATTPPDASPDHTKDQSR